jgi:hypothetical protein
MDVYGILLLGWREGEKGRVLSFGIKEKVQLCGNMIELCKKSKIKQAAFFFFCAASAAKKYSSIV